MQGKKGSFTEAENGVLRDELLRYRKAHGLSQGEMGEKIGIAQQNVGRAERGEGGLNRSTANALARLLGYRDAEEVLIARGVFAELQSPPRKHTEMGASWADRDMAVRIARRLQLADGAIRAVVSRFTDDASRGRPIKWWLNKFYLEEVEQQATGDLLPAPPESQPILDGVPVSEPKPAKKKRSAR